VNFPVTGRTGCPDNAAFHVDDDGISSNWVEFGARSFAEGLEEVPKLLATLRCVRKSRSCGVLNMGEFKGTGEAAGKPLTVVDDPVEESRPNPGHALAKGVAPADGEVLQALTLLANFHSFGADALSISKNAFGG